MYLIGAYVKLYKKDCIKRKSICLFKILLCLLFAFVLNYCVRFYGIKIFDTYVKNDWFINYISPFIIMISYYLLLIFKDFNINNKFIKKIIIFLSSTAFSVYIIHSHPLIYYDILHGAFIYLKDYSIIIIATSVVLYMIGIYILCTIIDVFRKKIFKITKIDDLCNMIGNNIDKKMDLDK